MSLLNGKERKEDFRIKLRSMITQMKDVIDDYGR